MISIEIEIFWGSVIPQWDKYRLISEKYIWTPAVTRQLKYSCL